MAADYCEMCDLPLSTCVHGMPPPPPAPAKPAPAPRTRAPRAPRATSSASSGGFTPPTRRAAPRFTSPDVIRPHIVEVLQEAGGELEVEELFARLEERLGETLRDGDREKTPEGELRWRYATRRARQGLIADGLLAKGAPGTWSLA